MDLLSLDARRILHAFENLIINATHDIIAAAPGLCSVLDFPIGGRRRGSFNLVVDQTVYRHRVGPNARG